MSDSETANDGADASADSPDDGTGDSASGTLFWATRLGVFLVVAALVAVGIGVVPGLLAEPPEPVGTQPAELNNSEYDPDDIAVTEIPARGGIDPDVSGSGTVVIDQSHSNNFDREDVQPLYEAFTRAGYNVVFYGRGDLDTVLRDADAFVVIDPGAEYDDEDTDAIKRFTDTGGRVLVLAEPNTIRVQTGLGGAQVVEDRSYVANIGAAYNLSFRTSYVYNLQTNDGNYKNPLTTPVGDADGAGEDVALYTAARVVTLRGGETILRYPAGSHTSGGDRTGQFPAAVRKGNLIAVGDASFVGVGRYNVADNEAFLTYLVEFLLSGERQRDTPTPSPTPTPEPTDTPANSSTGGG